MLKKKIITVVKTKYFVDNNKKIKFLKKDINRLQNFNFKKIMGIFLTFNDFISKGHMS